MLILDEVQHLDGIDRRKALDIINMLRSFVDRKIFGIVMIGNGEIYRLAQAAKAIQLTSRMNEWRVEIGNTHEADVDLIIEQFGVTGKPARKWCIDRVSGKDGGGLRTLVNALVKCLERFGAINIDTLQLLERL